MKKISILTDTKTIAILKGASVSFGVRLDEAPSSDVTVSASCVYSLFTFSSALTFTTSNWMTPQTVTITGITNGLVEGFRPDTIILTPSGGGYSAPIKFDIILYDSGFSGGSLNGKKWWNPKILTTADFATKRAEAVAYIFNGNGLPTDDTPTSISAGYTGTMGQSNTSALVGSSSVNRLLWRFIVPVSGYYFDQYTYHIFSSSPNGKCVTINGGHGSELYHINAINDCLASGYDVLYTFMPVTQQNTTTAPSIGTGVNGHNDISTTGVDSISFHALELFFYDKIKNLNYCDSNYSYTEHYITGCSGGGQLAMQIMGLDVRFTRGVPMRGFDCFGTPFPNKGGDFEQGGSDSSRDFYLDVSFWDFLYMGCSDGRIMHATYNSVDSCCLNGFNFNFWKEPARGAIARLGGNFNLTLDTNATYATHGFNVPDREIMMKIFNA